jgi:hypothetical protein
MNITPIRQWSGLMSHSNAAPPRLVGYKVLQDSVLCGRNLHYPNLLISTPTELISPYDERVMSLQCDSFYEQNVYTGSCPFVRYVECSPVFFFAYNVDNYFHFLYDTLPYLYYYQQIKNQEPECRLLLQTSHPSKTTLPAFVVETLDLLGIQDYLFVKPDTIYRKMYVGLSMTHGGASSSPPYLSAYQVWDDLKTNALQRVGPSFTPIPKFYVSRRSWLSKHPENIGTNYTTRRKCINEDDLVSFLQSKGFQEIFCEDLTMAEKIAYFASAKEVAGVIGGGMSNALFCNRDTVVHCLVTPGFLEINARFEHSMNTGKLVLYKDICPLAPHEGSFSLYTRAKILDSDSEFFEKIGEICSYENGKYQLQVSKEGVAGFSQDFHLDSCWIEETKLSPLDKGLNSPYMCDLEKFKPYFQE